MPGTVAYVEAPSAQGSVSRHQDNSAYGAGFLNTDLSLDRKHVPYDSKRKWRIDVDEQRRDFVPIMENETVPPSDDGAGK